MSNQNYTLDIISHHPKFDSKNLRKYQVEGIETVGAWGDEPFEIKFKNNTYQKVQVKLSIDGSDILSGDKATTDVDKNMWVVNGYGTLSLKAWPETNNGGASFVFTNANNSVAVHTHGDLTSRGIIAAAVFVEGHVEPLWLIPNISITPPTEHHHHHHHYHTRNRQSTWYGPIWVGGSIYDTLGSTYNGGISYTSCNNAIPASSNIVFNNVPRSDDYKCSTSDDGGATYDSLELNDADTGRSLESLVAVGAGQHVDQKITYVTGLIKPTFTETVRVRYLWWDELQAKLRQHNVPAAHASGFPGDGNRKNIDLKGTPRMGTPVKRTHQEQVYSRV